MIYGKLINKAKTGLRGIRDAEMSRNAAARLKTSSSKLGQDASRRGLTYGAEANRLSKKYAPPGVRKAGLGIATAGVGVSSFVNNIDNDRQVSDPFYKLTMGSSEIDEYALGQKVGVGGLLVPFSDMGVMANKARNVVLRNAGPVNVATNSILNKQTFSDAVRANRNNNRPRYSTSAPQVDGSMAFGMYASRLG
jgi:hypothetical protein